MSVEDPGLTTKIWNIECCSTDSLLYGLTDNDDDNDYDDDDE